MKKMRYYSSFEQDFEKSANQNYRLPDNYKWVRTDIVSKLLSGLIYGTAVILGGAYCKLFLHLKVKGKEKVRRLKGDFFIYGNHTQPVGDVFIPALCVLPKRIFTVVSPANFGIPIIGKLLPYLGALPISDSLSGLRELNTAIEARLSKKHPIMIYPEAHVWEYYTGIRPFADTSFRFPAKLDKPAVAMTVTYKKSRLFKRPVMEVYLDGPFYPRGETVKEKVRNLHEEIYQTMKNRSIESNYEYIKYIKEE